MGPSPVDELSLFSGYGGFTLGLRLAGIPIRTVCYVENEPYAQSIIRARIGDGYLDDAPIWDDVRTFDAEPWRGVVDIVTAGFPCQPHSVAGRRVGAADDRNLWPDTLRIIGEVGPRFALLENVPGLLANGYAGTVVGELAQIGYDAIWHCVPAAAVGAPHLRWRWFCLAYARDLATPSEPVSERGRVEAAESGGNGRGGLVAGGAVPDAADDRRSGLGRAAADTLPREAVGRGELVGPDGSPGSLADAGSGGRGAGQRDLRAREPDASRSSKSWPVADAEGQRREEGAGPALRSRRATLASAPDSHSTVADADGGREQQPPRLSPKSGDGLQTAAGGLLNPRWVEWLMGIAIGWTSSEPLGTESYRRWWRSFSED